MTNWKLYIAGLVLVVVGAVTHAPALIVQGVTTLTAQAAADAAPVGGAQ